MRLSKTYYGLFDAVFGPEEPLFVSRKRAHVEEYTREMFDGGELPDGYHLYEMKIGRELPLPGPKRRAAC